jgi:hypothetical protein
MFSKVEPKLQAGVLIGLGVACADFATPNMMAISSPMIEQVEELGAELQLHLFRDRDVAEEADVPRLKPRRAESVAPDRAVERAVDRSSPSRRARL